MRFQRTFEVDAVDTVGSRTTVVLKEESPGDHPATLTLGRVDEQLLHMLAVSSPDGLVLSDDDGNGDGILCYTAVCLRGAYEDADTGAGTWRVEVGGTGSGGAMSGTLRVDRAAYDHLPVGTKLYLRARTPVAAAETTPGWQFALELSDAVQVPFQQVCRLGVLVGAAGGALTAGRSDAMLFAGPGAPPPELQDWCRNNDVTCAVSASA